MSGEALVLSCAQMRSVDRAAVERSGLPSLILMENAGRGVSEVILRRCSGRRLGGPPAGRPLGIVVVCGAGNNGGDGFVAARHLALAGASVRVLRASRPGKSDGDAELMARALRDVPSVEVSDWSAVEDEARWRAALSASDVDVIVDALLGTGLRSEVTGMMAIAIAAINATVGKMTVAVDIPSGMDGDTGRPRGSAVRADVTVTVGARKLGLVIDPAAGSGEVEVVGLGLSVIPDPALGPLCYWTEERDVRESLPPRPAAAHKGTGGHLLVVAGSRGKTGAALLSSRAALRAGAGLVTIASTAAGQTALDAKIVEAMSVAYSDGDDADPDSYDRVAALSARPAVRALAIGPGIPVGPGMAALVARVAREIPVAVVLDADALNLLGAEAARILAAAVGPRVVTPHPGEMARLCGRSVAEVQRERLQVARDFAAASRAIVVLKGARTLVVAPDGTAFVNPAVEPALATAGSGDVLTGVLAGLLSQGIEPLAAARAAVFLHGRAGSWASGSYGSPGVIAGDLPDAIAHVRAALAAGTADNR